VICSRASPCVMTRYTYRPSRLRIRSLTSSPDRLPGGASPVARVRGKFGRYDLLDTWWVELRAA
jgi:hypothetical protein